MGDIRKLVGHRKWLIVASVAVLVAAACCVVAMLSTVDIQDNTPEDTQTARVDEDASEDGAGAETASADEAEATDGSSTGSPESSSGGLSLDVEDDTATQDVAEELCADGVADALRANAQLYAQGETTVAGIVESLPLGAYADNVVESDDGASVLIEYHDVLDHVDDDAVECALAYNVVVVFCSTSFDAVTISTHEDDGHADSYRFTRADAESLLGTLDDGLLADDETWDALRATLFQEEIYKAICERAEAD